jgi:hypothetical protein
MGSGEFKRRTVGLVTLGPTGTRPESAAIKCMDFQGIEDVFDAFIYPTKILAALGRGEFERLRTLGLVSATSGYIEEIEIPSPELFGRPRPAAV